MNININLYFSIARQLPWEELDSRYTQTIDKAQTRRTFRIARSVHHQMELKLLLLIHFSISRLPSSSSFIMYSDNSCFYVFVFIFARFFPSPHMPLAVSLQRRLTFSFVAGLCLPSFGVALFLRHSHHWNQLFCVRLLLFSSLFNATRMLMEKLVSPTYTFRLVSPFFSSVFSQPLLL